MTLDTSRDTPPPTRRPVPPAWLALPVGFALTVGIIFFACLLALWAAGGK